MFVESFDEMSGFYADDFDLSIFDSLMEGESSWENVQFYPEIKATPNLPLYLTENDTLHTHSTTSINSRDKAVSKVVPKKAVHAKKASPYRKGMTVRQALTEGAKAPNMSRRSPTNVLVAFPAFDRCDSLVYIPCTLARLTNSDDMAGLKKLISTHMHKDCTFNFPINVGNTMTFNQNCFLQLMEISSILEPDRIMCVHSTKVVENQIRATMYLKVTDNQQLYDLISQTKLDVHPSVAALWLPNRPARLKSYIHDELLSEPIKQEIVAHADRTEDLSLYVQSNIVLTFDNMTKKVINYEMTYLITSIRPVAST